MKVWSRVFGVLFCVALIGQLNSCASTGAEYPPLKPPVPIESKSEQAFLESMPAVDGENQSEQAPLEPAATTKGESESDQPAPVQSTSKPVASHDESSQVRALSHGFVEIPAGRFTQGSPANERGHRDNEVQRVVTFSRPFLLQATPVTQGQWRSIIGNNPSYFSSCGENCPVERVSWYEAVTYLNRLSGSEGLEACYTLSGCTGTLGGGCSESMNKGAYCDGDYTCDTADFKGLSCTGYRLPTEAEWEYAARAKTKEATYGPMSDIGWYVDNSNKSTQPVGQKQANAWGLYDMLGNVWELSGSWYGPYGPEAVTDPLGPANGSYRVIRGCSWVNGTFRCRVALRFSAAPALRDNSVGFRPARSIP